MMNLDQLHSSDLRKFYSIGVGENKIPIFFEDNEILVLSRIIVTEDISGVQTSIINKIKKKF